MTRPSTNPEPVLMPPAEPRTPWHPVGWLVVAAAFVVGFANFPLRVVGLELDHLPGDPGDNRLNNFVLEHGYRYLTGQAGVGFWDAPMFYPVRRVTGWSDAHLGMLPIYAGVRAAGGSPEGAFQGHFLIATALNFLAAVWALRRLGFGPFGTAAGAFVFAFGLPIVGRLAHGQLHPRFLVPPAVVFGWEFLRNPRTGKLAAVAACGVGQLYLTVYIGYFLALLLGAGFVVTAARFRREVAWDRLLHPGRKEWGRRAAVVAASGLVAGFLLAMHASGIGVMAPDSVRAGAPVPNSWVSPPEVAWASPRLVAAVGLKPEADGEQILHPGLLPLLALAFGLGVAVRPGRLGSRGPAVAVAALSALLLMAFVTRWGSVWPYELLARLPGVTGIRVIGRIGLVLLFPMGIALAGVVDAAVGGTRRFGSLPAALVGFLCLAAVAADQWLTPPPEPRSGPWYPLRYPKADAVARQERIASAIRLHPGRPAAVYVFPSAGNGPGGPLCLQLEAMRASQDLGVPCVNGWSGYLPPGWDYFPDYRSLMDWLTVTHKIPADRLAGFVVVGDPTPDADAAYEATMREKFPPRPVK